MLGSLFFLIFLERSGCGSSGRGDGVPDGDRVQRGARVVAMTLLIRADMAGALSKDDLTPRLHRR